MKYLLQLTCLAALVVALAWSAPTEYDMKTFEAEYKKAMDILDHDLEKFKDQEYISAFGETLRQGLKDLHDRVVAENDPAKQKAAIKFGIESFHRLVNFIEEVVKKINE